MIYIIVAYDKNRLMGNHGAMPWKIKGEQKRYKELTTGNVIIMGRKTYEEMGNPLPDRINIVVSSTKIFKGENLYTAKTLSEALAMFPDRDNFVSGGRNIFKEALPLAEKLFVTEIDAEFDGDVYFPHFDETQYVKEINEHFDGEIPYTYVTYVKHLSKQRNSR